tara:strand:- start:337 stop:447 length:111 start_codon:yes stop_codon:yes gene_type:complete
MLQRGEKNYGVAPLVAFHQSSPPRFFWTDVEMVLMT